MNVQMASRGLQQYKSKLETIYKGVRRGDGGAEEGRRVVIGQPFLKKG
jgi:hypothetical protein